MGFEIGGLGDLQKRFDELVKSADNHNEEDELPLPELFNPNFMARYTRFSSFDEFMETGGFEAASLEEIEAIQKDTLDAHISSTTTFINWQEMKIRAIQQAFGK